RVSRSLQVLSRLISHHFVAIIIELGGGTIARHDYPQLVRSRESDLGFRRVRERMPMAARTFVEMNRREFHGTCGGEPAACGFENVERLWLKRRCRLGCGACLGCGCFGFLL